MTNLQAVQSDLQQATQQLQGLYSELSMRAEAKVSIPLYSALLTLKRANERLSEVISDNSEPEPT